jgi:23S rRNA (guanosine2251-2'-O)-methyltransferase
VSRPRRPGGGGARDGGPGRKGGPRKDAPPRGGGPGPKGGPRKDAPPRGGEPGRSAPPREARRGEGGPPRGGGPREVQTPAGRASALLYGRNAVREAMRGRRRVLRIWATTGAAADFPGATLATGEEIAGLCGSDAHQGVCAEVEPYPYAGARELLADPAALIVALDEVTDPQNLGAVCRTAECAGATGVVVPERRSAEVTPAVCKASAGAVEHLRVARVRNLADFLAEAKAAGAWCYGASAQARTAYDAVDWTGPVVLVLGSEGRGLRPRVAAGCDELVSLPLKGRIDSLNVSATAAVLLYEVLQSRSRG